MYLAAGAGRFMHLVVLHGYQGADADPEQLASTDHLFDAALGELNVGGQAAALYDAVGDFNVEPTKIPVAWQKGISAGLWVISRFLGLWPLVSSLLLLVCVSGVLVVVRRDFMIGCPLAAAAVLSCTVQADRWISPHLAVRTLFDYDRWSCQVTQSVRFSLLWLLLGCLLLTRVGGLSLLRSRGFGRYMMIVCSSCLGRMLFFLGESFKCW